MSGIGERKGEDKRVTLVAVLDSVVVGYTNVIGDPDYEPFRQKGIPEINDMNTVTRLRKNGIGTRMIWAAENLIRETRSASGWHRRWRYA